MRIYSLEKFICSFPHRIQTRQVKLQVTYVGVGYFFQDSCHCLLPFLRGASGYIHTCSMLSKLKARIYPSKVNGSGQKEMQKRYNRNMDDSEQREIIVRYTYIPLYPPVTSATHPFRRGKESGTHFGDIA